jgi:hypothetical protein
MTRSTVSRRTRRSTAVKFTTAMGRLEIGAPIVCVLLVAQAGALNAQAQAWSTPFAPEQYLRCADREFRGARSEQRTNNCQHRTG